MQYYKNYSDKNLNIFGELKYFEEKFYVNDIEVNNNRGIKNDIVYIENNNVIGIKERINQNIIGIIYLNSKIKYGLCKDKELFLFKPTDKSFPNFYVAYKNKENDNINKYIIINFKEWNITNKLPIGTVMEIIGKIGDKLVEFEFLRNYYNIRNNTWKIDYLRKVIDIKKLENINLKIPDYEVFSIDPKGSNDIDDAFHFKEIDKNLYEIGIHIASPTIFFENDIEEILNRVSTIYLPDKKYNLIPNIYAEDYCSLLENKNRYALSLILKIKDNKLLESNILKTVVKSIKNYNYDEFDKIIFNTYLNKFKEISKNFFKEEIENSHKLVENWMIYSNKLVAKYLIEKNYKNIIIRKHDKNDFNIDDNLDNLDNLDSSLLNYLKIKRENSALYELYESDNLNQTHSKMNNEFYTHFTSPIRRAVDQFIHLLIINQKDIFEKEKLNIYIDKINTFTKNSRKFSRMVKRLDFLFNIKEKEIITFGYITKIIDYYLIVYIPEYNLEEKIVIIPKKFNNLNEYNEEMKKYNLYQKLNIKLWVFTSFDNIFDKLKIEILNF
jgi:exoribonuclease R